MVGDSKGLVLVVEDERAIADLVRLYLTREGFGVHVEADGAAGLAAAQARPADLVLLDVNMPVMDGEEMLRRLRAAPETAALPVIVVSTEGSEARRHVLEALDVSFIRKPFKPEELRALILRATGVTPDDEYYATHAGAAPVDDGAFDF